jgi:hypothetical protein
VSQVLATCFSHRIRDRRASVTPIAPLQLTRETATRARLLPWINPLLLFCGTNAATCSLATSACKQFVPSYPFLFSSLLSSSPRTRSTDTRIQLYYTLSFTACRLVKHVGRNTYLRKLQEDSRSRQPQQPQGMCEMQDDVVLWA